MNVSLKNVLLVVAGLIIGLAAHAQTTRQLIKPADATSGTAFAGPSIIMPVIPSNICTSSNGNCYSSQTPSPDTGAVLAGTWCGNASSTTNSQTAGDVLRFYYVIPCQGHRIIYTETGYTTVTVPAQPAYYDESGNYFEAVPAYDYQNPYRYKVNDCPIGYFTLMVSSEQNEVHHSCLKS